jgi:hypothetical protein
MSNHKNDRASNNDPSFEMEKQFIMNITCFATLQRSTLFVGWKETVGEEEEEEMGMGMCREQETSP